MPTPSSNITKPPDPTYGTVSKIDLYAKTAALGAEVEEMAPDRIVGVVRGVEEGRVSAVAFHLARLIFWNLEMSVPLP